MEIKLNYVTWIQKDISKDVKRWFHTSGYDKNLDRPLEIGVNKNVLGKFKD